MQGPWAEIPAHAHDSTKLTGTPCKLEVPSRHDQPGASAMDSLLLAVQWVAVYRGYTEMVGWIKGHSRIPLISFNRERREYRLLYLVFLPPPIKLALRGLHQHQRRRYRPVSSSFVPVCLLDIGIGSYANGRSRNDKEELIDVTRTFGGKFTQSLIHSSLRCSRRRWMLWSKYIEPKVVCTVTCCIP